MIIYKYANWVNNLIKVAHVITDTNIGGAGHVLLAYLNRRSWAEFDVSVIVPEGSLLIPELSKAGVKIYQIQNIAEKSFSLKAVFGLRKIFREMKPDIVHTHAAFSARIAAKFTRKCKIVHTRHSVFDQSTRRKKFPIKHLLGFINNFFSNKIIAVSPAAKANVVEIGTKPEKVVVVYNGIEPLTPPLADERDFERAKWGFGPDDFVCSIVARLEPEKGHDYILQAAKRFKEELPYVRILISGTGSQEQRLREEAASAELENVIFTGFIEDVNKLFSITDLSLNASYGTEATSLALLEGMSIGIPAVASDFGGNPYVVSDGLNGLLFPKKNSNALFDAVEELYHNTELYNRMSVNAYEKFMERFTAQAMTEGIESVYKSLMLK